MRMVFQVAALGMMLLSLAVIFVADRFWPLDLLTFFWPIVALFAVAMLVLSMFVGGWSPKIWWLVAALIAAYPIVMLPPAPDAAPGNRLRVLTANLFVENPDPKRFVALLTREYPDVVVTEETRPWFVEAIRASGLYPFESSGSLYDTNDKKVFSRYPIREQAQMTDPTDTSGRRRNPMRLLIDGPDGPFVVYAIHPDTPRSFEQWLQRNAYFGFLARSIAQEAQTMPVIVAGDWNMPAYSPFFTRLFAATGYRFARPGLWLQVTRFSMRSMRFGYYGSTIDHLAVSPQVRVTDWRRGPDFGSNHLPVIVDVVLPASSSVASR